MLGERLRDGVALELTEVLLTVLDEDVGDRLPGCLLDVEIGVPHGQRPQGTQTLGNGGLPGPHGAHQDDARAHLNRMACK